MEQIKKYLQYVLFAIFIVAIGFGVYYAIRLLWIDSAHKEAMNEYKKLQREVTETTVESEPEPDIENSDKKVLPEYAKMAKGYSNFGGWLKIDGTLINYPVMMANSKDPDYYLEHSYTGKQSDYGCLYIPYYENYDSDNVIIYGHNCARGDMFGTLNRYLKADFFKEHPFIYYDTPYEHRIYVVFAVMRISVKDPKFHFEYYTDWGGAAGRSHFYIEESIRRSVHKPVSTPADGSKLLTLVTCEYTIPDGDGRYVVIAKDVTARTGDDEKN